MTEYAKCPVCDLRHYSEKITSCIRCGYVFLTDEIADDEERIKEWLVSLEADIDSNVEGGE